MNVGTTLFLFAPLLLAGRGIESRLEDVKAGQSEIGRRQEVVDATIATLAEEVSQTQGELQRTREELARVTAGRIAATREKDRAMIADIENATSHEAIFAAMSRAAELNLITATGCRVPIHNTRLFLWFETPEVTDKFQEEPDPDGNLYFRLERIDGHELASLSWPHKKATEDFLLELADAVVRLGEYPGDGIFDAGRVFSDLREMLELAYSSATRGTRYPLTGVVQFCPPQWVVTERGLVSVSGSPGYSILFSRLDEFDWCKHMSEKTWLDQDSFDDAYGAGVAMFEEGKLGEDPNWYDDVPF